MAADEVHGDPGRDLGRAIVERHPSAVHMPHRPQDVVDVERRAEHVVTHRASGAKRHFAVLQVERGVREEVQAPGVVVVHVGDDHVLHLGRVDAGVRQRPLDRRQDDAAGAPAGGAAAHARVDHDHAGAGRPRDRGSPRRSSRWA